MSSFLECVVNLRRRAAKVAVSAHTCVRSEGLDCELCNLREALAAFNTPEIASEPLGSGIKKMNDKARADLYELTETLSKAAKKIASIRQELP